jgi:hypothetical protein
MTVVGLIWHNVGYCGGILQTWKKNFGFHGRREGIKCLNQLSDYQLTPIFLLLRVLQKETKKQRRISNVFTPL